MAGCASIAAGLCSACTSGTRRLRRCLILLGGAGGCVPLGVCCLKESVAWVKAVSWSNLI